MSDEIAAFGRAWTDLNPGWVLRTWREWDLPALRNQMWFDRAPSFASRADIARLELLYRFGGVYVDTDEEPLRPIEALIADTSCFIATEDGQWLATGVVGSAPRHPFIALLVDGIAQSILANVDAPPNVQTGPKYVTRRWMEYEKSVNAPPVSVFPPSLFYPYHFSEPEKAGGPFPEAYAVHHWAKSWDDDGI
jgi:mannosyltransferase OCH1-like enzyme